MKRTILLACAVLALGACSKEENGGTTADGRTALRLTSGIEATTRGEVQNTEIVAGETVYAWVSDAGKSGTDAALYNAEELTAQAGGGLAGSTSMYFPQTGNAVNIRALHGTFAAGAIEADQTAFPASVGFEVAADQSAGGDAYVESDLLYAASDDVARTKSAVTLTFYHMLSKLELKIVKSAEITDNITKVTLDGVAVSGTFTPAADADLTEQANRAAMIAAGDETATMTLGAAMTDGSSTNDAIVVPQPIGGKTMTFTLESGGELVYTIPADKTFESGKKHVYTVTLKGTGLSVESTIEPWDDSDGPINGDATLPPPAKVGDYFYSDGTYSTALDPNKTVIGIVFQTDKKRIGEAEKKALAANGVTEPHGLVMAVKNVGTTLVWSSENKDFDELTNCETKDQCNDDISGLHNYNTVIAYAEGEGKLSAYPAFEAVKNYGVEAPANTTGWYLPAVGQWYDFFANLGGLPDWSSASASDTDYYWTGQSELVSKVNAYFSPLGDGNYDAFMPNNDFQYFWSSSEYSSLNARRWNVYSNGRVNCIWNIKNYNLDVRPVLAF